MGQKHNLICLIEKKTNIFFAHHVMKCVEGEMLIDLNVV